MEELSDSRDMLKVLSYTTGTSYEPADLLGHNQQNFL